MPRIQIHFHIKLAERIEHPLKIFSDETLLRWHSYLFIFRFFLLTNKTTKKKEEKSWNIFKNKL